MKRLNQGWFAVDIDISIDIYIPSTDFIYIHLVGCFHFVASRRGILIDLIWFDLFIIYQFQLYPWTVLN